MKTIACDKCGERYDHIPDYCDKCGEAIYDRMDPHVRDRIKKKLSPKWQRLKRVLIVWAKTGVMAIVILLIAGVLTYGTSYIPRDSFNLLGQKDFRLCNPEILRGYPLHVNKLRVGGYGQLFVSRANSHKNSPEIYCAMNEIAPERLLCNYLFYLLLVLLICFIVRGGKYLIHRYRMKKE